jgi:hypothetical protein
MNNVEKITRPNFFPGQWIDYKDFNKLAEQPERMLRVICQHLFQGGGIIVNSLKEFEVSPLKGLSVLINPGVGLLPSGQTLLLNQDLIVDLNPYVSGSPRTVIVSLVNETKGTDLFCDESDRSIRGYRAERLEPSILVTSEPSKLGLEIFRVTLDKKCEGLRLATKEEEWTEGSISVSSQNDGNWAVIDQRFRRTLVPQTYLPADMDTLMTTRKALFELQSLRRKVMKLYLQEDPFDSETYLLMLHAELLSRPFQPLKLGFLAAEFSSKMALFLELLLNRAASRTKENFDKDSILKTIAVLSKMKRREVLPRSLPLQEFCEVTNYLAEFVRFAEAKFSLMDVVEEALLDLSHRGAEFGDKIVLGGHLFERVDKISSEDEKRYVIKADSQSSRRIATAFKNGDRLDLKGIFFGKGEVACEVEVKYPDRPLVLISRQHVRRAGARLQYEINGKLISVESLEHDDLVNNWRNKGLVVKKELLVQNKNLFRIRVEKTDLDFGFFDLFAFQPAINGGEKI